MWHIETHLSYCNLLIFHDLYDGLFDILHNDKIDTTSLKIAFLDENFNIIYPLD